LQKIILKRYFKRIFWKDVLRERFERMFWKDVLEGRFGRTFWKDVLEGCFGRTFWKDVLEGRFGKMFWKNVLRISGNNPLDLLYNSNKRSNAVRPRGLGGTPINKKHLKKESYIFTPRKFPICGLYIII
jgi:hypothetical protein